jgi:hypothetical protein
MSNYHHKPIKKFSLDGSIYDDSGLWRLRIEYTRLILSEMRIKGYVPRIDINPDFTIEYVEKAKLFKFELSLYGIYVGKRKSEWIFGIDETRVIPIRENRSSEYSQEAAQQ